MTSSFWTRKAIALGVAVVAVTCTVTFFSVRIDPTEASCQFSLERSMAMHQNRRNYHQVWYQEADLNESSSVCGGRQGRTFTTPETPDRDFRDDRCCNAIDSIESLKRASQKSRSMRTGLLPGE